MKFQVEETGCPLNLDGMIAAFYPPVNALTSRGQDISGSRADGQFAWPKELAHPQLFWFNVRKQSGVTSEGELLAAPSGVLGSGLF